MLRTITYAFVATLFVLSFGCGDEQSQRSHVQSESLELAAGPLNWLGRLVWNAGETAVDVVRGTTRQAPDVITIVVRTNDLKGVPTSEIIRGTTTHLDQLRNAYRNGIPD